MQRVHIIIYTRNLVRKRQKTGWPRETNCGARLFPQCKIWNLSFDLGTWPNLLVSIVRSRY